MAVHFHHVAFYHLMFTSSVFFVNLHKNEFVFHLTGGREVNLVFSVWLEYPYVGKQELILEFILGFKK